MERTSERYDVVVVGAGISGLICANFLAREGKQVLLLEQNHQPGGNMSGFRRKGFYFDGGDQSFESLGIVFPILRELGLYDPADWIQARFRMTSRDFDFVIESVPQVKDALMAAFPREPGIARVFDEVQAVSRFLERHYRPDSFPLLDDFRLGKLLGFAGALGRLKRWTTYAYRERALSAISDPVLRHWFSAIGYYRMPYLFFAGFWHIWAHDYWYPRGGMQAFHDRLDAAFRAAGGTSRYNALVTGFRLRARRAEAVILSDGSEIAADNFVYAGDYKKLVNDILGPELFPPTYVKRVREARLTEEILTVYLGVKTDPAAMDATLGGAQHPFYFPNYEVIFPDASSPRDVHRNMWVALNHFGAESPAAPAGSTTLTLQTYSSYAWQNHWQNGGASYPRTQEYRRFKEEVAWELVDTAENLVPGLRDMVTFMDVGTPLSLERFSRNTNGSTGGWCYDDKVSLVWRPPTLNRIRTPVTNLRTSGHYALWPGGVISAALSGRIVANLVSGRPALAPLGRHAVA